jgi:hypothetical protein
MTLVSNKYKRSKTGEWAKHPRPFLKRIGNKKLRRDELLDNDKVRYHKKAKYKKFRSRRLCPFCLDNIFAQNIGNTFKFHGTCKKCGSQKIGNKNCPFCKSDNIWKRKNEYMCKRCGKSFLK